MAVVTGAYEDLSDTQQIDLLRPVAVHAAQAFGLEIRHLDVVLHAYNTTFALDTADGRRVAMRIGTNSHTTAAHAIAQQEWISAIAAQTDVLVPTPIRTLDGAWWAEIDAPQLGRSLLVTVAAWLEGADADALDRDAASALGRTMATLHQQAASWQLPPGGALPRFDAPLFGDRDVLSTAPGLSTDDRQLLRRATGRARDAFDRVCSPAAMRPLHADLHGGNLKWHKGRLAVFDFDDAGLGPPALDLAISTFYVRGEDPSLEAALRAGYALLAPLPEAEPSDVEALIAARQLLLANALLLSTTADLRANAAPYLRTAIDRLRRWQETGRFTRVLSQ